MARDESDDQKNRPGFFFCSPLTNTNQVREKSVMDHWVIRQISQWDDISEGHCCGFFSLGGGLETDAVEGLRRSLSRRFDSDADGDAG